MSWLKGDAVAARHVIERGTALSAILLRTFAYSSGRVIALCRFAWALVFLGVLWVDPQHSAHEFDAAYLLLGGYLLWAMVIATIVWRSWWLDHRLALFTHIVDCVSFLALVVVTERASTDFTSPFLAFFAFLLLAAAIRWGWQATLLTGLSVTLLYVAIGWTMSQFGLDHDLHRFGRRVTYMSLLALVMAWFTLRRGEQRIRRFRQPIAEIGDGLPLRGALRHAAKHTFAHSAVIAWADHEEPHTTLLSLGDAEPRRQLGPDQFDPQLGFGRAVRLFDRSRGRILRANEDGQVIAAREPLDEPLAALCGFDMALALPISGPTGRGEILLADIPGLCRDHVQLGGPLVREISSAFDRHAALSLTNEMAISRMREAIARDLHDSVVQSLAGAALRVEGMRGWVKNGGDLEPEIDAVQRALREEQAHVRALIARLRQGAVAEGFMDAASVVRVLLRGLEDYWNVTVRLVSSIHQLPIPTWMAHELDGILKEAVANAVRHGGATDITVELDGSAAELAMLISDNGRGFPGGADGALPRSINERVRGLGGLLDLLPQANGACMRISLPLGGAR